MAGIPKEAGAKIVNRLCGSSMDATHQISQAIDSDDISCGIAGGTEDMFGVPMGGYTPSFNPVLYEKEYYKNKEQYFNPKILNYHIRIFEFFII